LPAVFVSMATVATVPAAAVGVGVGPAGDEAPPAGHEANIAANARPARRRTAERRDTRQTLLLNAAPVYTRTRGFTRSGDEMASPC
jgi:hypothetical protein